MDRERQKKIQPTDYQKGQQVKNETLLTKAKDQLDEEHDDVKEMNNMVLYSKVVTIRDRQLLESKRLELEYLEEQKRIDLMMEIERLKTLRMQEEREAARKQAQKEGCMVIIDQIKEREMERIREQEMREKEAQMMLKHIDALKQEEVKMALSKKERAALMMTEVESANHKAIEVKGGKVLEEKDLEQKIVDYNRARAGREEEELQEKFRVQAEKEREVQKLRDMQEKAQDRQGEIDALRAKRAFEESERLAREKERKEQEWKQKVLRDMEEARQAQFSEKERRLAEQAKQERDEFMRVIGKQREVEEQERRIAQQKKGALKQHSQQLRTQIVQNDEVKKQERLDFLEEGRKVRQKIDEERQKIQTIKERKLHDLEGLAIEEKYTAQLARKKIQF